MKVCFLGHSPKDYGGWVETPIQKAIPGKYPLVVTTTARKSCNNYQFDKPTVCIPLVSSRGHGVASLNRVYYQEGKFALGNILCGVTPIKGSLLLSVTVPVTLICENAPAAVVIKITKLSIAFLTN